jgi:hypothetical protein
MSRTNRYSTPALAEPLIRVYVASTFEFWSVSREIILTMRTFTAGLNTKLMESEVDRAHMSTYIHHEEEAQGDEYWDEEEAPEYKTTSISHEHLPDGAISSSSATSLPTGCGAYITRRVNLKENLGRICETQRSVLDTKANPKSTHTTPRELEVNDDVAIQGEPDKYK